MHALKMLAYASIVNVSVSMGGGWQPCLGCKASAGPVDVFAALRLRCAARCVACHRSTMRRWSHVDCALRNDRCWIASRERGGRRWVNSPRLLCSIVQHLADNIKPLEREGLVAVV